MVEGGAELVPSLQENIYILCMHKAAGRKLMQVFFFIVLYVFDSIFAI